MSMNDIPKFYTQRERNGVIAVRFYDRIPDTLEKVIHKELKEKFFNKWRVIKKENFYQIESIIINKLLNLVSQGLLFQHHDNSWSLEGSECDEYYQYILFSVDYELCPCCSGYTINLKTGICKNCGFIRSYPFKGGNYE